MNNFAFILTMAVIAVALPLALHKFSELFTQKKTGNDLSPNADPDPATSKFYLGNFWYRQTRWSDISSRIMPFFVVASMLCHRFEIFAVRHVAKG